MDAIVPTSGSTTASGQADPVVTELIRSGLVAITEEMKTNLMRTAYNVIIYEALDFTVGLFNAAGDTLSIGIGLPSFIRGMSDTVKAKLERYGDDLHEGDVLLTNDAYVIGGHLNNVTFTTPIFHRGKLIAFASCMAHWQDIGGVLNGMTTDIYSEGLQIPICKIVRKGEPNEELLDFIQTNVRVQERAMGDLRAQIAAVKTGERRVHEMIGRFGPEAFVSCANAILAQSEAAARARLREIPNGVYEAESFMDDDGVDIGKRIRIHVKVTVEDETMTIDLSGVGPQVKGFYNSGRSSGLSTAQFAFKSLTSAGDYPINDGCFRPLSIILPEGTAISATKPAAMRWWMTYPMTVVDTIFKALAKAIPEKVAAAHHADLCSCMISGLHPRDGKLFLASTGLIGGGWGAKYCEDGVSGTICANDGDTHNAPCEQVEAKFPLVIDSYSLRPGSAGAGQFRGGLGTQKIVRALSEIVINVQMDRVHCPPWGLFEGFPARGNEVSFQKAGEPEQVHPTGKMLAQPVLAGDRYALRSGGGGGYGHPLDRALELIERDIVNSYVSLDEAEAIYGAVVVPGSLKVDREASEGLRKEMRSQGLPKPAPGSLAATSAPVMQTTASLSDEQREALAATMA